MMQCYMLSMYTLSKPKIIYYLSNEDPCAGIVCTGMDSNRCLSGECVCGSTGSSCSTPTPICFGDDLTAVCRCFPGSCTEPNPVCDSIDGICKVWYRFDMCTIYDIL